MHTASELSILNQSAKRKSKLLRRQFDDAPTRAQIKFDIAFGIVLPVLCFVFDPLIFRDGFADTGSGMFENFQLFAYFVAATEIVTLALWLIFGRRLGARSVVCGSVMLAGFVFSFLVGMILLPFSIIGLVFIIGILGFAPFLSAFVFLRNGWRAISTVTAHDLPMNKRRIILPLLLGSILILGSAAGLQWKLSQKVSQAAEAVIEGDRCAASEATSTLRYVNWLTDAGLERIVSAYHAERDAARRTNLAHRYRQITGEDIAARSQAYSD